MRSRHRSEEAVCGLLQFEHAFRSNVGSAQGYALYGAIESPMSAVSGAVDDASKTDRDLWGMPDPHRGAESQGSPTPATGLSAGRRSAPCPIGDFAAREQRMLGK